MEFKEFAEDLRQLRLRTIANPARGGFVQTNGTCLRAMETELYYSVRGKLQKAGKVGLFYIDTDPHAKSLEAQMVRTGLWEKYEVGWLAANVKGVSMLLAKVSPSEKVNLDNGFISDSGTLVLRRE